MADDNNTATPENLVDGGAPTDEEARLAAQLGTIGDNPSEDPDDVPAADAAAAGGGDAAADDHAGAASEAGASDKRAAETTTAAEAAPATTAAPHPVVPASAPEPPRDFEAAFNANQEQFDRGEIDAETFQKTMRDLSREESGYLARVEIFNERMQTAARAAEADFAAVALAWEAKNKAFMDNPLYAQAMQQAIAAVDQREPGLAAADLLVKAEKAAFEFTRYTPPVDTTAADEAARKAKSIADAAATRKPGKVPATLSSAPTAAHVDAPVGNSAYAQMDSLGIDDLENQLARMSPDQVEAYLRDAPGANATGQ